MKFLLPRAIIASLILFFASVSLVHAATYTIPATSTNLKTGDTFNLTINLDTQGAKVMGADILLKYDPNYLEYQDFHFYDLFKTNYKQPSAADVIRLASSSDLFTSFTGNKPLVRLTFKAKAPGTSSITFVCTASGTTDSNVISLDTGEDLLNCASLPTFTVTTITPSTPPPTNTGSNNNQNTGDSGSGSSSTDHQASCPPAPEAARSLRATPYTATSILLTWDHSTNATQYGIKYGTSPNIYSFGASNVGHINNFLVEYLSPGTTYHFAVFGSNGCSSSSDITASATTLGSSSGTTNRTTTPPRTTSPTPIVGAATRPSSTPAATNLPSFTNLATRTNTSTPVRNDEPLVPETPIDTETSQPTDTTPSPRFSPDQLIKNILLPAALVVLIGLGYYLYQSRRKQVTPPEVLKQDIAAPRSPTDKPIPHALQVRKIEQSKDPFDKTELY